MLLSVSTTKDMKRTGADIVALVSVATSPKVHGLPALYVLFIILNGTKRKNLILINTKLYLKHLLISLKIQSWISSTKSS